MRPVILSRSLIARRLDRRANSLASLIVTRSLALGGSVSHTAAGTTDLLVSTTSANCPGIATSRFRRHPAPHTGQDSKRLAEKRRELDKSHANRHKHPPPRHVAHPLTAECSSTTSPRCVPKPALRAARRRPRPGTRRAAGAVQTAPRPPRTPPARRSSQGTLDTARVSRRSTRASSTLNIDTGPLTTAPPSSRRRSVSQHLARHAAHTATVASPVAHRAPATTAKPAGEPNPPTGTAGSTRHGRSRPPRRDLARAAIHQPAKHHQLARYHVGPPAQHPQLHGRGVPPGAAISRTRSGRGSTT